MRRVDAEHYSRVGIGLPSAGGAEPSTAGASGSNWILLDASTSSSITPVQIQSISRNAELHTSEEQRLQTINRLNDKVQKGILDSYKNPRRLEDEPWEGGKRVIDESFRFIENEPVVGKPKRERVITQRDEEGELEAVYELRGEKRLSDESRKSKEQNWKRPVSREGPYGREQIQQTVQIRDEPIYAMTRIGPSTNADTSPPRRRYRKTRADSLDSGSMRLTRRPIASIPALRPSATTAYSQPHLPSALAHASVHPTYVPSSATTSAHANYVSTATNPVYSPSAYRPRTLLRRAQFYDKCDVCADRLLRIGEFCPVCNRGMSTARISRMPYSPILPPVTSHQPHQQHQPKRVDETLLSAHRLNFAAAQPTYTQTQWSPRTLNRPQSRVIGSPRRYAARSPVFRYGPSLPRTLYDYEVWSQRKKDLRKLRTLLALSLALLALALVISTGAVLAAVGTN